MVGLAPGSDAVAGGPYLSAYVQSQAMAYRLAAGLGLVGAVFSAPRGVDVQPAPPVGKELPYQGKDEQRPIREAGA